MKYTLAQNAISSLSIAIDNFKKFYYDEEKYIPSEINEAKKVCIVFLENSIELMIKDILISIDPLFIYKYPDSSVVKRALSKVTDSLKLEDILISEEKFETISYTDTIKKYDKLFHKSEKVYKILANLGQKRNAITHFGIDESEDYDEFTILLLNTFDVIYNYLYPQLCDLDDIDVYFKSDDWIVDTIHGKKFLFDDNGIYNNIVDFLDELMETSKEYICTLRAWNPNSKIGEFRDIMEMLIKDKKYIEMQKANRIDIDFKVCDFDNNEYSLEINQNSEYLLGIYSCYSPFFNVTAFCGEDGQVYFIVVHNEHKLYSYKNGICEQYNLSKRNLLLVFKNILQRII